MLGMKESTGHFSARLFLAVFLSEIVSSIE
jgi:hypothetical protein